MQIGGGEKLKPGAKKSFCTYHMHETRGVNYVGSESTWRGEGNRWDWRNFGVKDYLTPKLRACVTPFLARVNLLGKRPMENGLMLGQRRRRNKMGLWARSRHCSRWSYGRHWRMKLASYLLDFASFKLGKFISCVASCNLAVFARG